MDDIKVFDKHDLNVEDTLLRYLHFLLKLNSFFIVTLNSIN